MDGENAGISRRRVLIGTAWLTPAIVLAVAVPRAAASTVPGDDVVVISSVSYGPGWGDTPNSVGIELSVYLAAPQNWLDAGVTSVPVSLVVTAVKTDDPDAGQEYSETYAFVVTTGGESATYVINNVPNGTYSLTFLVTPEAVTGTDGNSYLAAPEGGGPASVTIAV